MSRKAWKCWERPEDIERDKEIVERDQEMVEVGQKLLEREESVFRQTQKCWER